MNTTSKFIAGAFSLILLGIIVVGPVYLSEKLEQVETSSNDDVITFSEVIEGGVSYEPYLEMNEETVLYWNDPIGAPTTYHSAQYGSSSDYLDNSEQLLFNVDGFNDLTTISETYTGSKYVNFRLEVSAQDLLTDSVENLVLYINCENTYCLGYVHFMGIGSEGQVLDTYVIDNDFTATDTGATYYNITLTETILNNGVSTQSGASYYGFQWAMVMKTYTAENPIGISIEFEPDYFEVVEDDEYNNSTIAVPYISTFSTYAVHKVSMGLGGLLIFGFGWLASPFNRYFNNLIPVNRFRRSRK